MATVGVVCVSNFNTNINKICKLISDENTFRYIDGGDGDSIDIISQIISNVEENPTYAIKQYGNFLLTNEENIETGKFWTNSNGGDFIHMIRFEYTHNKKVKKKIDKCIQKLIDTSVAFIEYKTELLEEMTLAQCTVRFNSVLKQIANNLTVYFPKDDIVIRAKKRVRLAIDQFPVWVIKEVGSHMYKYRKQILAKDMNFFIKNNYDEEMEENVRNNPETAGYSAYLMPRVKDAWKASKESERADYYTKILKMLKGYIDFMTLV
jgi:hypothetical protein